MPQMAKILAHHTQMDEHLFEGVELLLHAWYGAARVVLRSAMMAITALTRVVGAEHAFRRLIVVCIETLDPR